MVQKIRVKRPGWAVVWGALLCAAVGMIWLLVPVGDAWSRMSYDLPFVFRHQVPEDLVLVYLDEETKVSLEEPANEPLSLRYHTRLMKRLTRSGARLILYNVLFDQRDDSEIDASEFHTAIHAHGRVVLAAGIAQWQEADFHFVKAMLPPARLLDAAAGVGMARLALDPDYAVRRIDPGTDTLPSLSWSGAALLDVPATQKPRESFPDSWLNHSAPPEALSSIKFEQAIAADGPKAVFFRDKIVVVGMSPAAGVAGAQQDRYGNPYSRFGGPLSSGATLHAMTLHNLMEENWVIRPAIWEEMIVLLLIGIAMGGGLATCRPLWAILFAVGGMALVAGIGFVLTWYAQIWFAWLVPVSLQLPLAAFWSVSVNAICDFRDKGILATTLKVHFSPARVQQVLKNPEQLKPGAVRREVSLLITDIQSFSKVTALMHPEDLVPLINGYYEQAIRCVHETEGTVMDLVGDSMFALWNAPDTQLDYRERACRTAMLMDRALRVFDDQNPGLPLQTRIGMHAGTVWVGNIGSSERFDYAALGEAVNLASRLQGLNKTLGTRILATRDIQRVATQFQPSRLVGHFAFHGIDQPVAVYEFLDPTWTQDTLAQAVILFGQGLHHFQRREFDQAANHLNRLLKILPNDGPARFYLNQIRALNGKPLGPDWLGIIQLDAK